ncbi:MAG: class I SAM-dependent methyltransferase [Clostridia bacterium]|nr:class I SAM-dependent methyltransferase [Clostridia bacterium]
MIDLLDMHKAFIRAHLTEGGVCADFTMGNGNDTEFLCRTVGESGRVYAFDIQEDAVKSTRARLEGLGFSNYTLIHDSHANLAEYIKEPIKAGMFNLGYLPGHGHHEVTTKRESTLAAVKAAIEILDKDAILLVAVYPGHEEGKLEGEMLEEYFSTISRYQLCVTKVKIVNSPTSPYFFVLETK